MVFLRMTTKLIGSNIKIENDYRIVHTKLSEN